MRTRCRARLLLAGLLLVSTACTSQISGRGELAADATPLTPRHVPSSAVGSCPGATEATRGRPTKDVIVTTSLDHLPLDEAASGPQSVRSVVARMPEVGPEATEALYAGRFREGYLNAWRKGNPPAPGTRVESVSLLAFADSVGSCAWADLLARTYKLQPVPDAPVPGMVAEQPAPPDSGIHVARYVAVKDTVVIDCAVVVFGGEDVTAFAKSLFAVQYQAV